jgi:DNA invertase Pin-like site-specific DNA recombinase
MASAANAWANSLGWPSWPTVEAGRTIAQIEAAAEEIERDQEKEAAAKAARQRASRLKKMAADPTPYLRKTEQLVAERSTDAYEQIAELLADLREALAPSGQSNLPEKQAFKLKTENPTLRLLTAALRRRGFLPK